MLHRAFRSCLLALGLLASAPLAAQAACGAAETPCTVPLGTYQIALPAAGQNVVAGQTAVAGKGLPVVIFFHGAGGLGSTVLEPGSYLRPFVEAGYAVIGANGLMRPGNAFGTGWSFRPESPQHRDELAYVRQVLDDATQHFGLDRKRVLVTGFSIGASLVWYLACRDPGLGAAYAPIAGGFWRPHPVTCAGPVDLLQTHGWRDRTVPLEGRPLRGGEIVQGDVFEGMQLWRTVDGCRGLRPDEFSTDAVFWRRTWTVCDSRRELSLALHPGDHDAVPMEWAPMAQAWFEARLKARSDTN